MCECVYVCECVSVSMFFLLVRGAMLNELAIFSNPIITKRKPYQFVLHCTKNLLKKNIYIICLAQSAGAAEYTDCISPEK